MRKIYACNFKKYNLFIFALSLFCGLTISSNTLGQNQQTFSSSGIFTVPAGVTQITVECWGGGGNGGARTSNGIAGGGGGGAYARKLVTVTPGNYTVTVGSSGQDSWFGTNSTVLAKGGSTPIGNVTTGASGGAAAGSIGDIVFSGGNGASSGGGISGGGGSSAGNSANGNNAATGAGGAAPTGGGKGADGISNKGTGNAGNNPGGGGSGGYQNGTGGTGGAGAPGQVIITYYSLTGTSVATVCRNTAATITLNSSGAILKVGTYDVTYNLTGTNTATGNIATMTVTTAGTGTFSTATFANAGSTTVTITNLASGFYSSSIGASNTATLTVGIAPTPTIIAGTSTTFCTGGSVVLTSSSASSYKWYQDGVLISGATSQTYTATTSAAYTVITTNVAGCTSPVSLATDVTVNTLPATPTITAGGPTTFCADGSLTLTSTTASTWQWYKGGVLIGGATNQTYLPTTTGTYTVVVTNSFGCFSSASSGTAVVVNPLPASPTITPGGATTFCSGGTVTLTSAAATTYKWYDDNGIITGATNQNFTASTSSSYIVRVTNSSGCVAVSAAKIVTVNPLPDITIALQATSLCSSTSIQTTQLEYTNTDNSPTSYSITWSAAAITAGFANVTDVGLPVTPISISVPANVVANTYTGTLTVKNANGCQSASKSFTVTVMTLPNVSNFSIAAAGGCEGTGALITVTSTSIGDGVYNIKYDLTGSNVSTNNTSTMTFSGNTGTFTALALNTGSTTITITEVSLVGCATPVILNNTATFTVNSLPAVPIISGTTAVCVDGTITLSASPGSGTWESSEPSIGTITNLGVVSGLIGGATIITYTTPLVNGCSNKSTQNITVNALPTVQGITGLTSYCVGTTSTLSNLTPNGTWSSSDPTKATIDNITGLTTAVAIGTTIITYTTPTDISTGCANSTIITVTVSADPGVIAGADLPACESSTPAALTLSGASYSGGASSALWTIENSGSGSLSAQGTGTNPSAVTYTPAANFYGTITLQLTTNTLGTCGNASATRLINITQKPTATPGSAITICQSLSPSAITLTDALVGGSANTGAWSIISGGGVLSDVTLVTDPANVTYTPASNYSGTVTLRLTTEPIGVCGTTSADRIINVTAIPTANAGTQNSVCQSASPGTFALTGASVGGGATNGAWAIILGTGTLSSTAPTATPAAVTFLPTANFTGTVKLTLTTNTPAGCGFETAERIIDVTAASTVIAGGPNTVCQSATPLALTLAGTSVGGGATTGTWSIVSGGGILSSENPETNPETVTYTPDINYTGSVSLLLTTNATGNCAAVSTGRVINVSPNATITLTSLPATTTQPICFGAAITNITYAIGGGGAGATFSGLPAGVNGAFNAGVATISGTPTLAAGGTYNYTVTTTAGTCTQPSAIGSIIVNPLSVGGTIADNQIICQNAQPANLVLSGNTGGVVKWQKSTTANFTVPTTSDILVANVTLPGATIGTLGVSTYFRAVVQSGNCGAVFSNVVLVAVNAPFIPILTAAPNDTICLGQSVTLSTNGFSTQDTIIGGNFNDPAPTGWTGMNGNSSNNNNFVNNDWGRTNDGKTYGGTTYIAPLVAPLFTPDGFMITSGTTDPATLPASESFIATPVFSSVGRTSLALEWYQGYKFLTSAVGRVEISIDGGTTYTTLAQYNSASAVVPTNPFNTLFSINLNSYLGQSNLKIRFYYIGTANSSWAIDDVKLVGPYQPVNYTWSINGINVPGQTVTVTPVIAGDTTFALAAVTGGCVATSTSILVHINNPVSITTQPATTAFCVGGSNPSISVIVTGSLPTYQWQISTTGSGGPWSPLIIAAPYSVVSTSTTSTLTLTAPPVALSTNFYRVVVTGATGCGPVTSNPIALKFTNVWTGATSIDWNTATNWSDGTLPSLTCPTVYIPNTTNKPTLNTAPAAVINNLVIDPSAILTVSGIGTIKIAGTITNAGTFNVTDGTVDFNGTSAQSIAGSIFNPSTIKNLIVSNTTATGLSITSTLNITGELGFGSSNATLTTGDNIVLISTATGTARVTDITNNGALSGNKFTGNVTVERYFTSRRAWRLFTAPIAQAGAGGSVFNYWQIGGGFVANRGTYVSGTPVAGNGIDASPLNNSSLKFGNALSPVLNTNTTLVTNNAGPSADNIPYFIFVRGDRTPANFSPFTSNTTTLSSKGKLQTGPQVFTDPAASPAFTMVGNPYASPVDFSKLGLSNLNRRIYVWDPYLNADQGGYITLDDPLNNGSYSSIAPLSPGGFSKILQSGQAFWVEKTAAASSSVTFNENTKSSAATNLSAFRPTAALPSMRTSLYHLNTGNTTVLLDGNLAEYDNSFNKGVDNQDALKFTNIKENLALLRDGSSLAIERRPTIQRLDTLFLLLTRTTQRNYRFEFAGVNLDPLLTAFLEDSYKGTKKPLSITDKTLVDFEINADAASSAPNRFRIVFKQTFPPFSFINIQATEPQQDHIAVDWKVENEQEVIKYQLEKSIDTVNYTVVNTTNAIGTIAGTTDYKWQDPNPLYGNNYYRVRSFSNDGTAVYSKTVLLQISKGGSGIFVYPNPVNYNLIGIALNNQAGGKYKARLLNSIGQTIFTKEFYHARGTSLESMRPEQLLLTGVYYLEVTAPNNNITKIKILVK